MGSTSRFCIMLAAETASHQNRNAAQSQQGLCCVPNFAWREKVSQWCYDVADHLNEDRSIVYVAMNILDRYCDSFTSPIDEKKYEIASLSAIFLAVHVAGSGELTLKELISMSRGGITVKHIVDEATNISNVISLKERIVTPFDFVRSAVRHIPSTPNSVQKQALLDSASYMIELAVCDSFFSGAKASSIAIAAMLNALETVNCAQSKALVQSLIKAASIGVDSFDSIKLLRNRLHCIYNQSVDKIKGTLGPHIIEDDVDDETDERTSYHLTTTLKRSHAFIISDDEPDSHKRNKVEH